MSYRRRLLQGKIDILRAELVARLQKQSRRGESELADVERLSDILAAKDRRSTRTRRRARGRRPGQVA